MTVKIAILKSGEQIISDISEGFAGEKMVCYIFNDPCLIFINGSFEVKETDKLNENKMSVSLYPWPTLTTDKVVQIPLDVVTTLVNPNPDLKELYEIQVLKNGKEDNQSDTTAEQSDTNLTD